MSNRSNCAHRRSGSASVSASASTRSRSSSHTYDLRSKTSIRTHRSKSANSNKTKKKESRKRYLGEKKVVTIPNKSDIPSFKVKGKSWDYTTKNVRENYMDVRTIDEQIAFLEEEKKGIETEIQQLKVLKNKKVDDERPNDWRYKSKTLRTTYFDERQFVDGRTPNTQRVVTVVWTHSRSTGVTRIGAVVWTKGHSSDQYDKYTQRQYATARYSSTPMIIKLDPVPQTVREVENCLRWVVHELGVHSKSKKYVKWMKRVTSQNSQNSDERQLLKNPLAPGMVLY